MAQATGTSRRVTRQVNPIGGIKLPEIDMKYLRPIVLGIGGLIFMGILILTIGMFKSDPPEVDPNTIWLGDEWTYNDRSQNELDTLIGHLQRGRIATAYAWVSWLQPDGTWAGIPGETTAFTRAEPGVRRFAEDFKAAYPEATLYGWIRFPAMPEREDDPLGDEDLQQSVAEFAAEIAGEMGFDGVFLEVEGIWTANENFLQLLRAVRAELPEDALFAVLVPPDWTPTDETVPRPTVIAEGTALDQTYKQRVALLVDQLVLQAYGSFLTDADDYAAWTAYQVQSYAAAMADLEIGTDIIVGVPAYEESPPAHLTRVENLTTALTGVQRGLTAAGNTASYITGVGIYAAWGMSDPAWDVFVDLWTDT
jgi:hypothetical protein